MDPAHNQTPQGEAQQTNTPVHNATLMGILAYLGPLVFIPFILAKDVPFVKFHIKQGLVLFVLEAVIWLFVEFMVFMIFAPIAMVANIGLLILSIIGIINVTQGKQTELPLLGTYASLFKF
jgi:uncharacterized membrane protein